MRDTNPAITIYDANCIISTPELIPKGRNTIDTTLEEFAKSPDLHKRLGLPTELYTAEPDFAERILTYLTSAATLLDTRQEAKIKDYLAENKPIRILYYNHITLN